MICVYYMTGTPEGSTESGFMEKLGIEPAIPGSHVWDLRYCCGLQVQCKKWCEHLYIWEYQMKWSVKWACTFLKITNIPTHCI